MAFTRCLSMPSDRPRQFHVVSLETKLWTPNYILWRSILSKLQAKI